MRGKLVLLVEEERRSVDEVVGIGAVEHAVPGVGAGRGVHVDLSTAGGSLLGVVHGSIHAELLCELRRRRGEAVSVGTVDRAAHGVLTAGGLIRANVEVDALRGRSARALAVEEVGRVDAIHLESVVRVALAVGPDRLVAKTGVGVKVG